VPQAKELGAGGVKISGNRGVPKGVLNGWPPSTAGCAKLRVNSQKEGGEAKSFNG
jgi:hypothetical protein